jgi:D-alanyl-lipoteichoic acid acyltransferase DltB (MBOAT superfamily)
MTATTTTQQKPKSLSLPARPDEDSIIGKAYDPKITRRLLRYLLPYKWQVASALAWMFFAMSAYIAGPYLIKVALDGGIAAGNVGVNGRERRWALPAGTLAFTLELLADFSAYTDLSRGIDFLLGFKTSENFRSPYLSISPTDFWNRWHITHSNWLRDYIFFPLRRSLLQKKAAPALALTIPPL